MPSSNLPAEVSPRRFAAAVAAAAAAMSAFYLIGMLHPAAGLWGVHLLAYVPPPVALAVIGIQLLAAIGIAFIPSGSAQTAASGRLNYKPLYGALAILAGAGGIFFLYTNRVAIDMYGDTRTLIAGRGPGELSLTDVLGFSDYEPLTRYIHQNVAKMAHLTTASAYQIVSSAAGGLFIMIYLRFVLRAGGTNAWRLFMLVTGLLCGANELFFGYVEDYALAYLCMTVFLIIAWHILDGKPLLPWLLICFVVGVKLHLQMILFTPALVFLILHTLSGKDPARGKWITGVRVRIAVGVSVLLCGLLYFFVFRAQDVAPGHTLNETKRIFLPLFNGATPPHDYSLLSWKHLDDIVQEFLLAASPGLIVLLIASPAARRCVRWSSPRIVFYALGLFYFSLFDVTINTMLTPMRDWDMLALITPSILFFGGAVAQDIFAHFRDTALPRRLAVLALAFGAVPAVFFFLNGNRNLAGERLRDIGRWSFDGYYHGSAYILDAGCLLIPDPGSAIAERENILAAIGSGASVPDEELSRFAYRLGTVLLDAGEDARAEEYFRRALNWDAANLSAVRGLAEASLFRGEFSASAEMIEQYNEGVNLGPPADFEALLIAQLSHRGSYLLRTGAGQAEIGRFLAAAKSTLGGGAGRGN